MIQAGRTRKIDPRLAIGLLLLGTVAVWSVSQLNKADYESILMLPLLTASILFLAATLPQRIGLRVMQGLGIPLCALMLVSTVLLMVAYLPPLRAVAERPGAIARQRYSLSAFGYDRVRQSSAAAAAACGIPQPAQARNVLIDDVTYFAYLDSYRPLHRLGVLEIWNGRIRDPIAYLRSKRSDGIVMACAYLPANLRAVAVRRGDICCIGLRAGGGGLPPGADVR